MEARIMEPRTARAVALLAAAAILLAPAAHAQRVTGNIQGTVTSGAGEPQPGATVKATNADTAADTVVKTDQNGAYFIAGLQPGQYLITVTLASGTEAIQLVDLAVGQNATLDMKAGGTGEGGAEVIEIPETVSESRTSEVTTTVTRAQIRDLPQSSRNFLNFAQLAPGVRLNTEELAQNFSSGALEARQTNVFVDGVSLKNNIIEGGVVGQDSSRGNPFPQLAVGGFRVLTQNFKAEYEQAGTAIITAITRSGGNDFHFEALGAFQNKALTATDPFVIKRMEDKPEYSRTQVGGLVSGPVLEDKLFYLFTYEGNYQNRASNVTIGMRTPENLARFGEYEGTFTSPFREHLGFGKLTLVPAPDQTLDLTASLRMESDVRGFGPGGTPFAFESAEDIRNNVVSTQLRHILRTPSGLLNEGTLQFLQSQWNPGPENGDLVGQEFQNVIRIGGRDTEQDVVQRTFTLRDDVTLPVVQGAGQHVIKTGAKVALQHYKVNKSLNGNPLFKYRIDSANDLDFDVPFEAVYGVGEPEITQDNVQLGVYVQDDWQITSKLLVNVGVRWDVETNMLNNDYRTPDDVRAAVTELAETVAQMNGPDFFRVENYLTDGNDRPPFLGAIQPRLGLSYDVRGDQKTVLFAGAGRYYDRQLFNTGLDEKYRLQYGVRTFRFSRDGMPRDGQPTIAWQDSYLSKAALDELIASGTAPNPEIFLLENDTRPLHTDQYSVGVRQALGPVTASLTFSHIRGENGVGFYPANRVSDPTTDRPFLPVPGNFGNVLISADDIQTRFTGFYLTADKPYTDRSGWGASASYTLGWAKVRGDTFNFDFPTIVDTPMTSANSDERHRLVLSGIVRLPYDFRLSTLIQLGSGLPYNISDASEGFGANFDFRRNGGRDDAAIEYKQVDVRLAKDFTFLDRHNARFFVEMFNIFNWENVGDYDGFIPPEADPPNMNFGQPRKIIGPTRSLQLGLSYVF
jgi:hypothetical protein